MHFQIKKLWTAIILNRFALKSSDHGLKCEMKNLIRIIPLAIDFFIFFGYYVYFVTL